MKTPLNPSRRATQRVKDPLPIPTLCPYCGARVELKTHLEVYGAEYGEWPFMYACGGCKARVGLHPFTAIPLGTLADQETREARKRCKPAFTRLTEKREWSRHQAYAWLAEQLGIPLAGCHWGMFDVATCERAQHLCWQALSGKK